MEETEGEGGAAEETAPDIARVDLGVSVRADSVASATNTARERAASLITALKLAGVAPTDIATTGYNVHPEFDHHEGRQRLLGYRVSNDLQVVLRDLTSSGTTLDAALSAAGDEVIVNGFTLTVSDDTEARATARESAWDDAVGRAEHLARLSGRGLGQVVSIVETTGSATPRPITRMAMAEATPIEAGTQSISVVVEVRFELS